MHYEITEITASEVENAMNARHARNCWLCPAATALPQASPAARSSFHLDVDRTPGQVERVEMADPDRIELSSARGVPRGRWCQRHR